MEINSLLNPSTDDRHGYLRPGKNVPSSISQPGSATVAPKQKRVPKDAAIFTDNSVTVGVVNYPPYEAVKDRGSRTHHQEFGMFPLGEIKKRSARHIPYNSDKKDFSEKTGRESFEVFQYIFKKPGVEKPFVVLWDYNVGLVKMTPFFKACGYNKTIPAKAMKENPGLKDVTYSITGGALVCQGYWMPYDAAKALAATFCYHIRWALTPVFGYDFPYSCLNPDDPNFAKFLIPPETVQHCTMETNRFRVEGKSYRVSMSPPLPSIETPKVHFSFPWNSESLQERRVQSKNPENGYDSDIDSSDKFIFSPQLSPRSQWTPVNRSLSPPYSPGTSNSSTMSSPVSTQAPPAIKLPISVVGQCGNERLRTKRTYSRVASEYGNDQTMTRTPTLNMVNNNRYSCRRFSNVASTTADVEAAELLLSLCTQSDTQVPVVKRTRRGPK
ncbi:hypothetical protein GQ44DRAFT_672928 [Phaeosphaeriaceae sp. PMI808]|nr:hypothetical protein GQ44DRAFT_672928 [Phaeosphaeriaceae sp. PMI808]